MGKYAILFAIAALLALSGCASNPNSNIQKINCCAASDTPYECEIGGVKTLVDCANADKSNLCYDPSDLTKPLAPICPEMKKNECVQGDCIAMVCSKARSQARPMPTSDDTKLDTTPAKNANAESGGLVGKFCKFQPLDARATSVMKKDSESFVNTFRLGIMGDFADYDRARFYFAQSDYYGGAPSLEAVIDRFINYLKRTSGAPSTAYSCVCRPYEEDTGNPGRCVQSGPDFQVSASGAQDCAMQSTGSTATCPNPPSFYECSYVPSPSTGPAGWAAKDVRICEPRDAAENPSAAANVKWTCTSSPNSKTRGANDADYLLEDYGGDNQLAQLACTIGCRAPIDCADNPDLLVKGQDVNAPTAQNANKLSSLQFVDIGRLDQFGSIYSGSAGSGYGQKLYDIYKGAKSRYTDPAAPGPLGGFDYECAENSDCFSGICTHSNYQRTQCLEKGTNSQIDCGCVEVNACEMWFQNCQSSPITSSARDSCLAGLEICRDAMKGAGNNVGGKMIICQHDHRWKGADDNWNTNADATHVQTFPWSYWTPSSVGPIKIFGGYGWPPGMTPASKKSEGFFMGVDYISGSQTEYVLNGIPPQGTAYYPGLEWRDKQKTDDRNVRVGYTAEIMQYYVPRSTYEMNGALTDRLSCENSGCKWWQGQSNHPDGCSCLKTTWVKDMDAPKPEIADAYRRAWTAVPEWQAISFGTSGVKFNPDAKKVGGAFIFTSPGYDGSKHGAPDQDSRKWTGTKEEMMSTFPFIVQCAIPSDDIEEVDINEYGSGADKWPPGSHERVEGGVGAPQKAWRIKSFGKCQVDSNGWPVIAKYGLCEPKTYLTMAYQKVTDAYTTNDDPKKGQTRIGSYTGHDYGVAGYCPRDCGIRDGMCDCSKSFYYGASTLPIYGPQAAHSQPEQWWLSYAINHYQANQVLPLLDLREYTYDAPPPQGTFPTSMLTTQQDACMKETGNGGTPFCKCANIADCETGICEWGQVCAMQDFPDPLLSFLSENHSAAIVAVGNTGVYSTSTVEPEKTRNKVLGAASRCPKCTIALWYGEEQGAAQIQPNPTGIWNDNLNDMHNTLAQLTEIPYSGKYQGGAIAAKMGVNGLGKVGVLVLETNFNQADTLPGGYATALDMAINASRQVLQHTGWATLWVVRGSNNGVGADKELYLNITSKTQDMVSAGIIGVMMPPLNDSANALNTLINDGSQAFTGTDTPLCKAEVGTQNLLSPRIMAVTTKVIAQKECKCSECTKEDMLLGNCNAICMDGSPCDGYAQGSNMKCAQMCIRNEKCALCTSRSGEMSCNRIETENGKIKLTRPSVSIEYSKLDGEIGPAYAPQIGTLTSKCCLPTPEGDGKYTYNTIYRVQTTADPVVYPKYANNQTDCGMFPKPTKGSLTCNSVAPPMDDKVDFCK